MFFSANHADGGPLLSDRDRSPRRGVPVSLHLCLEDDISLCSQIAYKTTVTHFFPKTLGPHSSLLPPERVLLSRFLGAAPRLQFADNFP